MVYPKPGLFSTRNPTRHFSQPGPSLPYMSVENLIDPSLSIEK